MPRHQSLSHYPRRVVLPLVRSGSGTPDSSHLPLADVRGLKWCPTGCHRSPGLFLQIVEGPSSSSVLRPTVLFVERGRGSEGYDVTCPPNVSVRRRALVQQGDG